MERTLSTFNCPYCGKPIGICTVTYTSKTQSLIDQVRNTIKEWREQLEIIQNEQTITVTPRGYLGKETWYQINEVLKSFDAEWVSAGKESRWIIRKQS